MLYTSSKKLQCKLISYLKQSGLFIYFIHRHCAGHTISLNSNNKPMMIIGCYLLTKFTITLEVKFNLN